MGVACSDVAFTASTQVALQFSPSLSSPVNFPAIFSRSKMDDFLKLLEEESRRIVAGTESHFCDSQI